MCGIAAFSPKETITPAQLRVATQKIKILGLFNQSRGTDSCGILINNFVMKGVGDTSSWSKFIADPEWQMPILEKGTPCILHTRKSTVGAHSAENAHPFVVINKEEKEKSVALVHNGGITNIHELAKRHKVDTTGLIVDSKILAHLLCLRDTKTILEEYEGKAALIWSEQHKNNVLKVFHGASKTYSAATKLEEERPLYFMETPEGIYFSSMEESLRAIADNAKQIPYCLEYNVVYEVINGAFTGNKIEINREEANCKVTPSYATPTRHDTGRNRIPVSVKRDFSSPEEGPWNNEIENLILRETIPYKAKVNGTVVFYYRGRYWMKKKDGDFALCIGEMYINSKTGIYGESTVIAGDVDVYYFFAGIMLKGKKEYEELLRLELEPKSWVREPALNYAMNLSYYSMYPVSCSNSEGQSLPTFYRSKWYFERSYAKGSVTPKFSTRHYKFDDEGVLMEITAIDQKAQSDILFTTEKLANAEYNSFLKIEPEANDAISLNFDKIFSTPESLALAISKPEVMAILAFITDYLTQNGDIVPTEISVEQYMLDSIERAVNNKISIREALGDKSNFLEMYLEDNSKKLSQVRALTLFDKGEEKLHSEKKNESNIKSVVDDLPFKVDDEEVYKGNNVDTERPNDSSIESEFEEIEEQVETIGDNIMDNVEALNGYIDELSTIDNNDFATELYDNLKRSSENITHGLADIFAKHKKTDLLKRANNTYAI